MSEMLRVLTITDRLIPSNIIGIVKPMLALQKQGEVSFHMRYFFQYKESDIQWADAVILCRSIKPEALRVLELAKKHHKQVIYDIDDNFFELSISSPLGRYHRHPIYLYVVTQMIKYADAVRVYSKPMEEIAGALNERTYRIKSYFDFSCIEGVIPRQHAKIRIVYATSRGQADTLAQICIPAVARVLARYPQQVEFYTFGQIPVQLKGFQNAYKLNYIKGYDKYLKSFYGMNFDIGLAPLLDDRFHNSKTNNKFREYGAMEVCGVYSDAQIYRDCVIDRENGMLVQNTTEAWYTAICQLVEESNLRERIKQNAKECVLSEYSIENTLADWRKILNKNLAHTKAFYNILNLDIGILWDTEFPFQNYRIQSLMTLIGFCGIHHKMYDFVTVDINKFKRHDLCICFFSQQDNLETWLQELQTYQIPNLIVDTLFSCTVNENKYPNILFTNIELEEKGRCLVRDPYVMGNVDLLHIAISEQVIAEAKDSLEHLYSHGMQRIQTEQAFEYSIQNPIFEWADVLSRYEGSLVVLPQRNPIIFLYKVIRRILRPILTPICRFGGKLISSVCRQVERSTERMDWLCSAAGDYIRINILRRY